MARDFQKQHGIKYFIETSAKSGENVNQLFFDASKFLYNQIKNNDFASESQSSYSGSYTAGRSTYDLSPGQSRNPSANFPSLQNCKVKDLDRFDDDGLQLKDEDLNFPITKRKGKCKC